MAKQQSLLAAVKGSIPKHTPGSLAWYQRLKPADLAEVQKVKDAFKSGEIGAPMSTVARAIVSALASRGISNIGKQGVIAWLQKD